MPTPASGEILFSEIGAELNQSEPNLSVEGFYATSLAGGVTGLMYHNFDNMGPNVNVSAKNAIFDPFNSGANFLISNWYNYNGDPGLVMTFLITNSSARGVDLDIQIYDSSGNPVGLIFNGTVGAGTNTGTQTVSTSCSASTVSAGYRIFIQTLIFNPPPIANPSPPNPPNAVTFSVTTTINSASDSDGVGAGTTRTTYGTFFSSQTDSSPAPPPAPTNPFPAKIVDTSGGLIFNNKRTTFSITIS